MERPRRSPTTFVRGGTEKQRTEDEACFEKIFSERRFSEHEERPKTPEEFAIIEAVVPKLNHFLEQYGTSPLAVREHNIHLLDENRISGTVRALIDLRTVHEKGGWVPVPQRIIIPSWKIYSNLDFAHILVHELIHLLSFNSARRYPGINAPFPHRVGLNVFRKDPANDLQTERFFNDINEAVTEELAIRFYPQLQEISSLTEEYRNVGELRKRSGNPDIAHVITKKIEGLGEKGEPPYETTIGRFAYPQARRRLDNLIEEIRMKEPARSVSKEEIFTVFAKGAMTGDVKEIASLVEGLGHGRLRALAHQGRRGAEES